MHREKTTQYKFNKELTVQETNALLKLLGVKIQQKSK